MPRPIPKPTRQAPSKTPSKPELVSHIWLIKAIGFTVLAASICGYLTLCALFYQGQWQLVLHPNRASNPQTSESSWIHFGPDESATPQLTGRWLPAAPGARYANTTILFLPSGDGSLSDFNSTLDRLHNIGINVFAFDYRGYGFSADTRPNQQKMTQDADSAWTYLNTSRAIPAQQIIPYGTGVGASLATHLALIHPEIPALILDSPRSDLLDAVLRDPRSQSPPCPPALSRTLPPGRPPLEPENSKAPHHSLRITRKSLPDRLRPQAYCRVRITLRRSLHPDPRPLPRPIPPVGIPAAARDSSGTCPLGSPLTHTPPALPSPKGTFMSKWLNSLQPWGALLLRLVLGLAMIVHGYRKVVPHGALNHYAHYVVSLGLPYWLGYVSAFTEFVGRYPGCFWDCSPALRQA